MTNEAVTRFKACMDIQGFEYEIFTHDYESAIEWLSKTQTIIKISYLQKLPDLPKTVDEAVDQIMSDMTLDEMSQDGKF